jgi:hypothetical protein
MMAFVRAGWLAVAVGLVLGSAAGGEEEARVSLDV